MDAAGSTLKVLYNFEYEDREKRKITITRGEKLFLLCKTNTDWWHVIKNSSERPFFVPVPYVTESRDDKDFVPELHSDAQTHARPTDVNICLDSKACGSSSPCHEESYSSLVSSDQRSRKKRTNYSHSSDENEFRILDDEIEVSDNESEEKMPFVEYGKVTVSESIKNSEETVYANIHFNPHTLPRGSESKPCSHECCISPLQPAVPMMKPVRLVSDNERCSNSKSKDIYGVNSKNKLTKSRSFKTKSELQKISRSEANPVFFLPFVGSEVEPTAEEEDKVFKERNESIESELCNQQRVALVFQNELYSISNVNDMDGNKAGDSGNISSESLYMQEGNISDSGASQKSGVVSSAQSRESIQEHSDIPGDDTSKEEVDSSREDLCTKDLIEDVPIPEGWRIALDEDSGEQCYLNDATNAKTVVRLVTTSVCLHGDRKACSFSIVQEIYMLSCVAEGGRSVADLDSSGYFVFL